MSEKKHAGGRPPKYKTKEEMQEKIDEYFNSCYRPIGRTTSSGEYKILKDDNGNIIYEQHRPFTITGLADALDMSRQDLLNYQEKEEFFDTVTRAKRKCELYAEERLYDKDGNRGAMFSLSNNFKDWKEKQSIEANVNTEIKVTLEDD